MPTFMNLVRFTDHGIHMTKDSTKRFKAFKATAEKPAVQVKAIDGTQGQYDLVLIGEVSDEAAMTALIKVASLGNVRTPMLHAFSPDVVSKMIAKMP